MGFGAAALASVVSLQVGRAPHCTWDFTRARCIGTLKCPDAVAHDGFLGL